MVQFTKNNEPNVDTNIFDYFIVGEFDKIIK